MWLVAVTFYLVVFDSETPWTVVHQGPLSTGFFRQEYWSGLPFPPLGDFPDPGIKPASPVSPALQVDSLPAETSGKPWFFQTSGYPPIQCHIHLWHFWQLIILLRNLHWWDALYSLFLLSQASLQHNLPYIEAALAWCLAPKGPSTKSCANSYPTKLKDNRVPINSLY